MTRENTPLQVADQADLRLYSTPLCPYAHRTRLVLAEKRTLFELVEIDLENKPAWFSTVSIFGKVPALEHRGQRLVESNVINEYLDEVFPEPRLLPDTAARRALARIWMDYANTRLYPACGRALIGPTPADRVQAGRELCAALELIEHEAFARWSGVGPYSLGATPTLVDFCLYPMFEQLDAVAHQLDVELPERLDRLTRWREAMAGRESVVANARPRPFYVEKLAALRRRLAS